MRFPVERIRTALKSSFLRNVVTVGAGLAAAHIIALAFAPILTRIYGPQAYGVLGAYTAVVTIIMPLATLSYANAIVLPKDDLDAAALVRLSRLLSWFVATVVFIVILVGGPTVAGVMGLEADPWVVFFLPVSIVLSGWLSTSLQFAIRTRQFKARSKAHVESTLISNLARFGGGLLWPTGVTMISIFAVTPALAAWMLNRRMKEGYSGPRPGWAQIKLVAYQHRDFAILRLPQSILNAAAIGLPVLFLTSFFGVGSAGQYALARLILGAPVMLIGQSIGEVFYPKIAATARESPSLVGTQIRKATTALTLVSVVCFAPVFLYGPALFEFAFGGLWAKAGGYSQWLAIWLVTVLMNRPSVAAIPALKLQGLLLTYEVLLTAARVASLAASAYFFSDDTLAVAAFSIVGAVANVALTAFVLFRTRG